MPDNITITGYILLQDWTPSLHRYLHVDQSYVPVVLHKQTGCDYSVDFVKFVHTNSTYSP